MTIAAARLPRAGALALALLLTALVVPAAAVAGPPAVDAPNVDANNPYGWFEGGLTWTGQFADPDIVLSNGTYYAYSSAVDGRYLGVMTSTDLVHWVAHPHWSTHAAPWNGGPDPRTDPSIPLEIRGNSAMSVGDIYNLNDALVRPAQWGVHDIVNAWMHRTYWAVGVIKIGSTWFSYAPVRYSYRLADGTVDPEGFGRFCLTVSSAPSPLGPFRDITGTKPLYCDSDPAGSIDPAPFVDPSTGQAWITWRSTGRRNGPGEPGYPSALKSARLDSSGHIVGPVTTLLTTNEGTWEGFVVENPAMVKYHGRWYLFYSANSFEADRAGHSPYATGYAICSGPAGPCRRPSPQPLMKSSASQSGPGGASPFVDAEGNLRLVYAFDWPGEYRPNTPIPQPRRMAITNVIVRADGTLCAPPPGDPAWMCFQSPLG